MCDLWLKQVKKPNCTRPYCEPQIHTGKASYGYKLFGCVRLDGFRFCDKMRNPLTNSKKNIPPQGGFQLRNPFCRFHGFPSSPFYWEIAENVLQKCFLIQWSFSANYVYSCVCCSAFLARSLSNPFSRFPPKRHENLFWDFVFHCNSEIRISKFSNRTHPMSLLIHCVRQKSDTEMY